MVKLVTGICMANSNPVMTVSYSPVLLEHPVAREKE